MAASRVRSAKLIAGSPLYQLVLSAAAMRAVWRETRGQHGWELTRHVGAHIQEIPNKG